MEQQIANLWAQEFERLTKENEQLKQQAEQLNKDLAEKQNHISSLESVNRELTDAVNSMPSDPGLTTFAMVVPFPGVVKFKKPHRKKNQVL